MITENKFNLGSWKCGKGRAFTHIPTNFIFLKKMNSLRYGVFEGWRTNFRIKKSIFPGLGSFASKNLP